MGVDADTIESHIAVVLCQGDNKRAAVKYAYLGIVDCNAAQRIADGPKVCPSGCLGLGSCERACPFNAIEMTADGLAVISREKCTGCTKCIAACPRSVISMTPATASTHVLCNSTDKGAVTRKYCTVGCIGCMICKKTSPESYKVENFLATVVYGNEGDNQDVPPADGVLDAAAAIEKCPTKCIRDFREGYPEGSSYCSPSGLGNNKKHQEVS
jgi:electron transport complex protein RnfB